MSTTYPNNRKGIKIINPGSGTPKELDRSDLSRVLPRQLSTGSTRGTQTVGYGNTKIDGSNNRITIGTPDGGTLGFGSIPGSENDEFGFFSTNADGDLVMKIVDGTWYVYNLDDGTNVMQSGQLPDNTYGWAVAKEGKDVADGYI